MDPLERIARALESIASSLELQYNLVPLDIPESMKAEIHAEENVDDAPYFKEDEV